MVKKLLYFALSLLGLVGFLVCSIAIFGTWNAKVRLDELTDNLSGIVDHSLVIVEKQITNTQERVEGLRLTTSSMENSVKSWTRDAAGEKLRSRLDVEAKAEQIASGLQQTDDWLEFAESSLQFVERTLEVGRSSGVAVETDAVDKLIDEIATLRLQLGDLAEPVERIRQGAAAEDEEEAVDSKFKLLLDLTVRVIATLSSVDSRLESLAGQVASIQTRNRDLKAEARWWIGATSIGITLLLAWMAVGQASLCYLGWRGMSVQKAKA